MAQIKLLILFAMLFMAGCFSEEGGDASGGGLFSGHKPAVNEFSLTPPANGTYATGDVISFSITHPGILTVAGGTPSIDITIGGSTVAASYVSGTGTKTLNFSYTVAGGDNDTDGISIGTSLALNGATVNFSTSSGTQTATTTLPSSSTPSVLVDTIAPNITIVTPPADNTFLNAQTMTFSVTFDSAVDVTGTPQLPIDIGGNSVNANYVSGSGSDTLIFNHVVQTADMDLDGIAIQSPLVLNSGSIADAVGNNSNLIHVPIPTPGILVNGDASYVTTVTPIANGTYLAGQKLTLALTFNETVNVAGGTPSVDVDIDGTTRQLSYVSGSGSNTLNFEYTIVLGDVDNDGVAFNNTIDLNGATIQDGSFNNAFLNLNMPITPGVIVDALLPEVIAIAPPADATYLVGQPMQFTFTYNTPVTITGGTPRVPVTLETGTIYLDYFSGSGTANHFYRYVVQAGDQDLDGITLSNTLDNNGATLQDGNLTNANTDITTAVGAINTSGILIDAQVPYVTSITPPADGDYTNGQNLDFTLSFNQIVTVTNTPRFELTLDSGTVFADYVSGSGTTDLLFRHTVQPADSDVDGSNFSATAIDLNAGTIVDAVSNNANLDLTGLAPDISGITITGTGPAITSIAPPAPGKYLLGDTLTFTVNVDQTVNVNTGGGTPRLEVTLTTGTVYADYTGGTGTTVLTFEYTVGVGEEDLDGIELVSPLQFNGGTIQSLGLNNLSPNLTPPTTNTIFVDGKDPFIAAAVTPPANGTYIIGDTLDFVVTYDEPVFVSGTPRISIQLGAGTVYADYASGSGSTSLIFSYTVVENNVDADGISFVGTTIDLNSGSMQDAATNNADLDMTFTAALPDVSSVLVEAVRPTITGVTIPTNTYIFGDTITITVTFDDNVTVAGGTPDIPFTFNTSSGSPAAFYTGGTGTNTLTFDYVVAAGNEDLDGADLATSINLAGATIQDPNGNDSYLTLSTMNFPAVLVDGIIPTVAITTPADSSYINIANDSATFAVSGTCSEAGQTVTIKINGVDAASQSGFACDGTNFTGTIDSTVLAEGTRTFTAELTDSGGNTGTSATNNVTRDVTAPSITSITPPVDGVKLTNDVLAFIINYDENVTVVGSPLLTQVYGTGGGDATYASGSGGTALTFNYTVLVTDYDEDGIVLTSPLNQNAATMVDAAGNTANLTFTSPNTTGVTINNTHPQFEFYESGIEYTNYDYGDPNANVTVTFTVQNVGTAATSTNFGFRVSSGVFSILVDNCTGEVVSINGSCTIDIQYKDENPAGLKTGSVTADDNGYTTNPGFVLNLEGTR